jgi:uncharacterized protein
MKSSVMKSPIHNQIIWRITGACNLRCEYCHFFSDPDVKDYPSRTSTDIEEQVVQRIEDHIRKYEIKQLRVCFEGGEPLILGKKRLTTLIKLLLQVEKKTGCTIGQSLTTNATLLDEEWVKILRNYKLGVTVSLDGPSKLNYRRCLANGEPSYQKVLDGVKSLQNAGKEFGLLSVANPKTDPKEVVEGLVNEFGINSFDIMIPKYNYDDKQAGKVKSIATFFSELFSLWYENYSKKGIKIRICNDIAMLLLGREPQANTIRGGVPRHLVITSNGYLQPLYNLGARLRNNDKMQQPNVMTHSLDVVVESPDWIKISREIEFVPMICMKCEFKNVCKGGIPYTRYSSQGGYTNPTVYCEDIKQILSSAWKLIRKNLKVGK